MNSHTNINQTNPNRQPSQHILKPNQRVYLYGDTNFTGTLIRPLKRTYPRRWIVQLDRGGYDSATVTAITPIAPCLESNSEIPFGDEPQPTNSQLEREIIALRQQNQKLQQENEILKKDLAQAKQVIRRAKDISPLMRISLKRVLRLAKDACMDVRRTVGGWILKMGDKAILARSLADYKSAGSLVKFRRLADIWYLLSQDNWYLEEIFSQDKLVAVELILPPRPRKPPALPDKQTKPLMRPEDILRNRTMTLVKTG